MELTTVRTLYDLLAGDRFSFLYSGLFHDDHTARLVTLGEEFLEQEGVDKRVKGKLAFIMVEAYQNIIRHRAPLPLALEKSAGRSVFLLRSGPTQHEVVAVNPVTHVDADRLTSALEEMSGLDLKQMKEAFLSGLQSESRSTRGGAGLGLIEMTRRSGHPMQFGFAPLTDNERLFAMQVLVGKGAERKGDAGTAFSLQKKVVEEGISILCRGWLAAGEQEVIMRIIERDLDEDSSRSDSRMRSFLAATELLQNLEVVGEGPMIILGRSGPRFSLVVGTPLPKALATRFVDTVNEVNGLDTQGLQRRYRDILLGRGEPSGTLMLGLIDLARRSTGPLRAEQMTWRDVPFVGFEAVI